MDRLSIPLTEAIAQFGSPFDLLWSFQGPTNFFGVVYLLASMATPCEHKMVSISISWEDRKALIKHACMGHQARKLKAEKTDQ
jgi:hypothetical protein